MFDDLPYTERNQPDYKLELCTDREILRRQQCRSNEVVLDGQVTSRTRAQIDNLLSGPAQGNSEVIMVMRYDPSNSDTNSQRASFIHLRSDTSSGEMPRRQCVSYKMPHYLTLSYPLIHQNGESGWHFNMQNLAPSADSSSGFETSFSKRKRTNITVMDFSKFVLQVRDERNAPLKEDLILACGRLFQQYALDLYSILESDRLNYLRKNQGILRSEKFCVLRDALASDNNENPPDHHFIPGTTLLPSTYTGSPRWYQEQYQDAMRRAAEFGKPDLFITMTCNPKWIEFAECRRHSQVTHM